MDSVKLYITEEGNEYILGERIVMNDIRYLALYNQKEDQSYIAYEKDGDLCFIDENYPNFDLIAKELFEKMSVPE